MQTTGLSLDQAPPLTIPARFFVTAPLAIIAAGMLLFLMGAAPWTSPWYPQAMAWTHLGTLGFLAMVMFGSLYQMTPVVAGTAVPQIRLAYLVHPLLLIGVAAMEIGWYAGSPGWIQLGVYALGAGVSLFILPVTIGLFRSSTKDQTVTGMRLAIVAFAVLAVLGVMLSRGHYGGLFLASRPLVLQIHFNFALLLWVGSLITAVSWQVIPMFYLTPTPTAREKNAVLILLGLSFVALSYCLFVAAGIVPDLWPQTFGKRMVMVAVAPAAAAVWVLHPVQTLRALRKRKRARPDASLLFWKAGLSIALVLIPLGALAHFSPQAKWSMLWGWLAIWGWAGIIAHGMLTRIVPFLVWFHRMSPHVGLKPVPSMRGLLSQQRIKLGLQLHLASLGCGAAGMLFPQDWLAYLTGALLVGTGVVLLTSLITVLRRFPDE